MSIDDLWGVLPEIDKIETPYIILKEQAELLSQKTNGLLVGEVRQETHGKFFDYYMGLLAVSSG